jgi:membrane-anchored protein YejM (alkaline phosphatase superfamily)
LFAFAQRNGWSTGVDGWYNPYCHILASVLNACSWEPSLGLPTELFGAAEQNSVLANGAVLPNALLAKLTNSSAAPEDAHVVEYRNVMARTQALIQNDHIRFVFLHLPVPHPPGIYNRQHHVLRPGGTYLDNLVLADDTLGALLKEIDATPAASRSTVIVSSDHSWRIPLWRLVPGWTAEEERASGGRFDDRPVLLIHFPGQISGNDVNPALPELLEHDIIAEMLRGKINSSKDLAAFLTSQGR